MPTELLATAATTWAILAVAGVGIAVLPWTAAELAESARAFGTVGRWVLGGGRARARVRA